MTIGDLLFFLTVLIFLGTILFVPFALLKRQVRRARKVSLIALLWMAGYLIALLGASLLTPQTVLLAHQEHCFDDMCFSVVSASTRETLGNSPSQLTTRGSYYLIAVQLRNAGRGRAQKPSSPSFVLVDQQGNSYEVVSKAEEIIGQILSGINSCLRVRQLPKSMSSTFLKQRRSVDSSSLKGEAVSRSCWCLGMKTACFIKRP